MEATNRLITKDKVCCENYKRKVGNNGSGGGSFVWRCEFRTKRLCLQQGEELTILEGDQVHSEVGW